MERVVDSSLELPARIERKYWYRLSAASDIAMILSGLLPIRRQHPDRYVNNVYFDTPGLDFFEDNVQGVGKRVKIRLRWYGDFDVERIATGALESKTRSSGLVTKAVCAMQEVSRLEALGHARLQFSGPDWLAIDRRSGSLVPVLVNRYRRQYFVSFDGRVRLTVDSDLGFSVPRDDIGSSLGLRTLSGETVVETKYSAEYSAFGDPLLSPFSTRATRHSKYVRGMKLLY